MAYTAIADLVKNDAFTRYFTKALLDLSSILGEAFKNKDTKQK